MHSGHLRGSLLALAILAAVLPIGSLSGQSIVPEVRLSGTTPEHITGLGFHGGVLHAVTKTNSLLKLNPQTGEQVGFVHPLINGFGDVHIHGMTITDAGTLILYDMITALAYEFSLPSATLVGTIQLPGPMPYGMAFAGGLLWVGHHSEGPFTTVSAVEVSSGTVLASWSPGISDNHGMAWHAGQLWILDNYVNTLRQVDVYGDIRASVELLGQTSWSAMAHDGTRFWAVSGADIYTLEFPLLTMDPLVSGSFITVRQDGLSPGETAQFAVSRSGYAGSLPGSGSPSFGLNLTNTVLPLGAALVDFTGSAQLSFWIPSVPAGIPIWCQGFNVEAGMGVNPVNLALSNVVASLTR